MKDPILSSVPSYLPSFLPSSVPSSFLFALPPPLRGPTPRQTPNPTTPEPFCVNWFRRKWNKLRLSHGTFQGTAIRIRMSVPRHYTQTHPRFEPLRKCLFHVSFVQVFIQARPCSVGEPRCWRPCARWWLVTLLRAALCDLRRPTSLSAPSSTMSTSRPAASWFRPWLRAPTVSNQSLMQGRVRALPSDCTSRTK